MKKSVLVTTVVLLSVLQVRGEMDSSNRTLLIQKLQKVQQNLAPRDFVESGCDLAFGRSLWIKPAWRL